MQCLHLPKKILLFELDHHINNYDYNQTFTYELYFSIKLIHKELIWVSFGNIISSILI